MKLDRDKILRLEGMRETRVVPIGGVEGEGEGVESGRDALRT